MYSESPAILLLPTNKGIEVVETSTVVRIQSISNYSKIYFANGKTLVVAKVLAWFEQQLPAAFFIRVHRSHIIHARYMLSYRKGYHSWIILSDETAIEISRRRKKTVMQVFSNFFTAGYTAA